MKLELENELHILKQIHKDVQVGGNRKILISILCVESLLKKWNDESLEFVKSKCPFCYECQYRIEEKFHRCSECICPSSICAEQGNTGIISEVGKDIIIRELNPDRLDEIRLEFLKFVLPEHLEFLGL